MKPSRKELIQKIIKVGYQFSVSEYRGVLIIPVRAVKRKVMKIFGITRFEFDDILLLKTRPSFHEDGLHLSSCGGRKTTNLDYVTSDHSKPTFMNSFCFFHINKEFLNKNM